ncbi:PTS transporter subunit EIIC [Paraclostridium bifermentans]|uniref:PTS transporter subunit EIIC n=1 Tax=Paraclostridium bifermentans TaxID=1490 RepID=A0ABY8R5Z1_PARBF|nr:PTS transporter subunit EIIC [Paraclostridium bifermentans]
MGVMLAGTLSYKLAEDYKLDSLSVMIISLVAYMIVTPKSMTTDGGEFVNKVIPMVWLGARGVITAIIMSILSTEIYRFAIDKKIVIKLPSNVPEMVSKSFTALVPGTIVVLISIILNGIFLFMGTTMHDFIYTVLQVPLQGLTSSVEAITVVAGLNGLLWWFGIHPTVVNSIVNPLLNANAIENLELFKAGHLTFENANVGTIQMIDQFATIGGAGMTIGLVVAMLIVARSQRLKMMSKLGAVPSLFNINEPLIFGTPIILNPLMLVPVTLAPIVSVLIAYLAMKLQFMLPFNGVIAPWTTPPIISGLLVSGWQGALIQLIAIVASTLIYLPFVKALDNQYRKEELEVEENNSESDSEDDDWAL